ncbi:immediate early response gene 5-like protein [Dreissena polymorpha]|uniref:Uncharacterized protein n=1 Tax=Dreissena polymorpha TaxID=45954 RepID=A0A9D4J528_DREPO|nr:immediate early response gene 5-like protein [Dreissena polymorpha]KAH3796264.1 hypothetical protein DPMN_149832 [Dreissena polymorpha]
MSATTDAQRLIAVSLGKIAVSRQQRCGINLHKNLLVASVLHKARTTYMMDNFQTLLAQKRAQAEKEAAAKMIVDTQPELRSPSRVELMESSTTPEVTDRIRTDKAEVPNGELTNKASKSCSDKENIVPVSKNNAELKSSDICDKSDDLQSKCCYKKDLNNAAPIVLGKPALSSRNSSDYVSQLPQCRCVGTKRRRLAVDYESGSASKRARFTEESDGSDSDFEYDSDSSDCDATERMQTESSQVTGLVDIFNSGFNGLCKSNEAKPSSPAGHINVYVSADRSVGGHQYVLKDLSCGTQIIDKVSLPTAIALAV